MANIAQLMTKTWQILESIQWDRLGEVLAPAVQFRLPGQTMNGVAEFRGMADAWWSAFPDLKHSTHSEIESGDTYACELVMTGTHEGTMRSPNGDIPATGKSIRMASCDYITVEDGKIVTWHAYPDMVGMLAQLGAMK